MFGCIPDCQKSLGWGGVGGGGGGVIRCVTIVVFCMHNVHTRRPQVNKRTIFVPKLDNIFRKIGQREGALRRGDDDQGGYTEL